MKQRMLTAFSREDIEHKIDDFLATEQPYTEIELILPAAGNATRFEYRGLHVREWHVAGNVRFDTAVEVPDDPMAQPQPLDVEFPCSARYSQYTRMVVMDAFIEAEAETSVVGGIEDFLGRLWNRGFKVVPNGDGQWRGDDNGERIG